MQSNKIRINKFDNMKGLAIFLIVLWHFDSIKSINPVVFKLMILTALPLFFFVSGYFSKIDLDQPLKSFRRLLIPFIIFSIITKLFKVFIIGDPFTTKNMFVSTDFALWFLVALFFMKMALPIVDKFKYPMLTSIICALIIGFLQIHSQYLGVTRFVGYFPIFLLGFYYKDYKEILENKYSDLTNFFKKHSLVMSLLAVAFILIVSFSIDSIGAYLFKTPFKGNLLFELIKRVLVITAMFLVVLLFNRYMTNRQCFLTKFGINSMAVYLLHIYLHLYLKPIFKGYFADDKIIFLPFVLILSFVITFVLSRDFVTKYLNKFTDSFYNLIVKSSEI